MNNENIKKSANLRKLRIGTYGIVMTAVVIVIAVIVNLIVSALPTTVTHINTDTVDFYSTGDETAQIIDAMKYDVTFYLIAERGSENSMIEELLSRYEGMSGHISVKNIDPAVNPTFISQYTSDSLASNSVIAVSELRSYVVPYGEIFTTEYTEEDYYNYYYYGQQPQGTTYFNGEMKFTAAIDYVTREDLPTVYALTGHGESELDSAYTEYITNENLTTDTLNLLGADEIPEDCRTLLIANPTSDISADEAEKIINYMDFGGDVVLVTDFQGYSSEKFPNLSEVAEAAGLTAVEGIVMEGDSESYYQYQYILIPEIVDSEDGITSLLGSKNINTLFWGAHGITEADGSEAAVTPIVRTSSDAEMKSISAEGQIVDREDSDGTGSVTVGAMAENTTEDGKYGDSSRFVWYSSASIIDTQISTYVGEGNVRLFVATLNYLCGGTASVSILGKSQSIDPLTMSSASSNMWMTIMLVVVPAAVIIIGFVAWYRRRRK